MEHSVASETKDSQMAAWYQEAYSSLLCGLLERGEDATFHVSTLRPFR